MNRTSVLGIILAVGISVSAQTVALKGKVTDKSGKAISGAAVTLKSKKLTATTDASGTYSITGTGVVNLLGPNTGGVSLNNGCVILDMVKPAGVRIDLFDMQGTLLYRVADDITSAGTYRFDLKSRVLSDKMVVARISVGQQTATLRYLPLTNNEAYRGAPVTASGSRGLAKVEAVVDTLTASASGYTEKMTAIESYEATVDITLETANCTANPSKANSSTVTGTGPHKVVIETNSDQGIKCGTIYRPSDLGPGKNYPIFVWGEGGCSQDGFSNKAAMGEIASWGYFVVADGTPGGSGSCAGGQDGKSFLGFLTWAIAQNKNPCSAYYQSLDTTKIAADGFSCGGLMAENVSGDPRFTATGLTSSGQFNSNPTLYKQMHAPFKIMNGGSGDMAYENGLRDYNEISALKTIPIIYFSKTSAGHGGDLGSARGDFNTVNLAWLNWQLKGDTTATGKALLMGANCKFCKASGWVFKSANWP
jgi:hypothetical protein